MVVWKADLKQICLTFSFFTFRSNHINPIYKQYWYMYIVYRKWLDIQYTTIYLWIYSCSWSILRHTFSAPTFAKILLFFQCKITPSLLQLNLRKQPFSCLLCKVCQEYIFTFCPSLFSYINLLFHGLVVFPLPMLMCPWSWRLCWSVLHHPALCCPLLYLLCQDRYDIGSSRSHHSPP